MKRISWSVLLCWLVFLALPVIGHADVPVKTKAFAYSITGWSGKTYQTTFAPPEVGTIYLMANVKNVVSPRATLIYFWPLTKEYLADWLSMDDLVPGNLQILQNGQVVKSLPLTPFVVQTTSGDWSKDTTVYTGDLASKAYKAYQDQQNAYWTSVRSFQSEQQAYEEQMAALGSTPTNKPLPEQPKRPIAPKLNSVQPSRGYVVNLPAGNYTVRVVNTKNQIWPGSQHPLVVFAPRRSGLGYSVLPQDRWTSPYDSNDPNTVIYVTRPMTLYLQPFNELEFNEAAYKRLIDPQDGSGRDDQWIWVHTTPAVGDALAVDANGQPPTTIATKPYYVKQILNAARGYSILDYNPKTMPGVQPSFNAYKLTVDPSAAPISTYLQSSSGAAVSTSQRELQTVKVNDDWELLVPGPIILLVGLGLWIRRRVITRQTQLAD